jgi:hypothetical protein
MSEDKRGRGTFDASVSFDDEDAYVFGIFEGVVGGGMGGD